MGSGWKIAVFIGIGISLSCSIAAICIASPHIPQLGFDYQGVLVGILSALVTILIGWQIWNLISAKDNLKKMSEEIVKAHQDAERQINDFKQVINTSVGSIFRDLADFSAGDPNQLGISLYWSINALTYAHDGKTDKKMYYETTYDIIRAIPITSGTIFYSKDVITSMISELNRINDPQAKHIIDIIYSYIANKRIAVKQ